MFLSIECNLALWVDDTTAASAASGLDKESTIVTTAHHTNTTMTAEAEAEAENANNGITKASKMEKLNGGTHMRTE